MKNVSVICMLISTCNLIFVLSLSLCSMDNTEIIVLEKQCKDAGFNSIEYHSIINDRITEIQCIQEKTK